jgi:hypothetical protein
MVMPINSRTNITVYAFRRPTVKAWPTAAPAVSRTAFRLGSNPIDPMVAVMMAVAVAKLMMPAPLRVRLSNPETMP